MVRFGLRIRPFESQSHFQSIANPPRPQNPTGKFQKSTFSEKSKNPKIRVGGNRQSPLNCAWCKLLVGLENFKVHRLMLLQGSHLWHLKRIRRVRPTRVRPRFIGFLVVRKLDRPTRVSPTRVRARFTGFAWIPDVRKTKIFGLSNIQLPRYPDIRA